jgi:hypothetical protein
MMSDEACAGYPVYIGLGRGSQGCIGWRLWGLSYLLRGQASFGSLVWMFVCGTSGCFSSSIISNLSFLVRKRNIDIL